MSPTPDRDASSVRAIAFYLPQFHPIPENDEWWGRGFTEWTNVAKAKPLFRGHYQPHVPTDLGFYDLRCSETRAAQAELAGEYGIEGFCYWHYWFAGKRLLERPFEEVLQTGHPNFPFCLGWANETWSGIWHGAPNRILMEQTYPGMSDHEEHFRYLLKAFSDRRYIQVAGKPMLVIYKPLKLPESKRVFEYWRELAHRAGLKGLYIVGVLSGDELPDLEKHGMDAVTFSNQGKIMKAASATISYRLSSALRRALNRNCPQHVYRYADAIKHLIEEVPLSVPYHPTVIPNWDNTPRSGERGLVLHGSTPELFRQHLRQALQKVADVTADTRILFLKSWNEWAEGNHFEPDLHSGKRYLEVLKDEIVTTSKQGN